LRIRCHKVFVCQSPQMSLISLRSGFEDAMLSRLVRQSPLRLRRWPSLDANMTETRLLPKSIVPPAEGSRGHRPRSSGSIGASAQGQERVSLSIGAARHLYSCVDRARHFGWDRQCEVRSPQPTWLEVLVVTGGGGHTRHSLCSRTGAAEVGGHLRSRRKAHSTL
jgi:hypothetical protein